ncbi:group III truncated hemoglobin [Streptomyces violascens]|uniref:group III truncated hemoglobin n=1 Tax=Streptomyces violascens TaxID=67381 RepID=UPI0036C4DC6F
MTRDGTAGRDDDPAGRREMAGRGDRARWGGTVGRGEAAGGGGLAGRNEIAGPGGLAGRAAPADPATSAVGGDIADRVGRADLAGRPHLDEVLRRFYTAAFADPLVGPYFDATDLDVHLPRIGDFWERALFRTAGYRRDAFAPHAALHLAAPLTAEHFGRWVQLWHASVDGLHQGPNAERAKAQGERIALAMLRRLNGRDADTTGEGPGFIPLAALTLRAAAA